MIKRKWMYGLTGMAMALLLGACASGGAAPTGESKAEGSQAAESNAGETSAQPSGEKVAFTIFNSKNEIQEYLEEAASEYSKANHVEIEVYYSQDTVSAHLATRYASNDPYTINMVDPKDIYSLGKQYGYDLSDQPWVGDTDYAIKVDNKVIGFPVAVEARGLLYNADAIKKVTGEDFDPSSIKNLDDFTAFLDKLVAGGMEKPTAILKPDWSLAAHYLTQVYEQHEDVNGFVDKLYKGEEDLMQDEKFNSLMDTFDVLMKYNLFSDNAISVEDPQVHQAFSEGEIAFKFGGNWEWNDIVDFDYTGNIGMMPLPQNMQDSFTGMITGGGSKYFYIDNSQYTTDAQRQEAAKFLQWWVESEEGKTLVSETCALVSPFKSNTVPSTNHIGVFVKQFADEGKMIPNYDYNPDDHYSVLGAVMQKYLASKLDRQGLADEIEKYWSSVTPVERN